MGPGKLAHDGGAAGGESGRLSRRTPAGETSTAGAPRAGPAADVAAAADAATSWPGTARRKGAGGASGPARAAEWPPWPRGRTTASEERGGNGTAGGGGVYGGGGGGGLRPASRAGSSPAGGRGVTHRGQISTSFRIVDRTRLRSFRRRAATPPPSSCHFYTMSAHDDVETDVSTAQDLYPGSASCLFYEKK